MIANKMTGAKGVQFTAAYINRFHEMENTIIQISNHTPKEAGLSELTNLLKVLSSIMEKQRSAPHEIAEQARLLCVHYGVPVISNFVKVPAFELLRQDQFSLSAAESA